MPSGDVRFIRITDIGENGCLRNDELKYVRLTSESKKYLLHTGDLVMARTGATYGKTLYITDDLPAVYASFLIKIIPNNQWLLNRFYWHFSKSSYYWEQVNRLVTTGGQPQFNSNSLKRVCIMLPSIEKQKQIVEILDHFDSLCNDLTAGLPAEIEARKKQYEYYRERLLNFPEKILSK